MAACAEMLSNGLADMLLAVATTHGYVDVDASTIRNHKQAGRESSPEADGRPPSAKRRHVSPITPGPDSLAKAAIDRLRAATAAVTGLLRGGIGTTATHGAGGDAAVVFARWAVHLLRRLMALRLAR